MCCNIVTTDHPGVPNPQLIKENQEVAERYKHRSVAEQKSFDIAWDLLLEDRYTALLSTICGTPKELQQFRQLTINSVMATDLGDKQLKELRNSRWEKAFAVDESCSLTDVGSGCDSEQALESLNHRVHRKATIVIEQ